MSMSIAYDYTLAGCTVRRVIEAPCGVAVAVQWFFEFIADEPHRYRIVAVG